MTLLVLNRRPIIEHIPDWLGDLEEDLVLLTAAGATAEIAARHPSSFGYRSVTVVDDYDDAGVEQQIADMAQRYGARKILCTTEIDVLRAARVRSLLGIPGQGTASAIAYRDKFKMKSLVADAGLNVPPMRLLESADQLRQFAVEVGFPVIIKPVSGGGSAGVLALDDHSAVDSFIAESPEIRPGRLLAESWQAGDLYHVDGLMAGGRVLHSWPSRYRHPNLETVAHCRTLASWMLPEADLIGQRMRRFAADVVAALPAPDEATAFHAEIFHTPDGRLVLCEIGCRAGGAGVVATYEHALGINLFAASLRGQAGLIPVPQGYVDHPEVLAGWCWFPPRVGQLHRVPRRCPVPGVYQYLATGHPGVEYFGARSVSETVAEILFDGSATEDLSHRVTQLEQWWDRRCRWRPLTTDILKFSDRPSPS